MLRLTYRAATVRKPFAFLFAAALAFLAGCGTVGEPQYPAVNIPARVVDITAVERGDKIDINFTLPTLTTEGLTLKRIDDLELRVGPNTGAAFDANAWVAGARRVEVRALSKPGMSQHAEYPARDFIGQEVVVAARSANAKGRNSEWSNLAIVKIEQPLVKPADFKAEAVEQGVRLTWNAANVNQFRVYRKGEQQQQPTLASTVNEATYLDTSAEFGKTYEYYVESVREKTESDVAGPLPITPRDIFPPRVPAGLTASVGVGAVELAWERNTESDFKEYRVFRSEGAGSFTEIARGLEAPSYSDRAMESGKRYRYRVTALDQSGNSSEPSEPVEAAP
jgi:hypothetical protein